MSTSNSGKQSNNTSSRRGSNISSRRSSDIKATIESPVEPPDSFSIPSNGDDSKSSTGIRSCLPPQIQLANIPKATSRRYAPGSSALEHFSINKLQFEADKTLYGREKQIGALESIWNQATGGSTSSSTDNDNDNPKTKQFVWIAGGSGCGKSALAIRTVKQLAKTKKGFYIYGKHELQLTEEPFAAIQGAFKTLGEELVTYGCSKQSNDNVNNWWDFDFQGFVAKLKGAFEGDDEVALLLTIFPSFGELIGLTTSSGPGTENGSQKDKNPLDYKLVFHDSVRRLIRLLTSFGSVAIVLDDLQWCDKPSVDLLLSIMTDYQTKDLMVVATYRDNEVQASCDGGEHHVVRALTTDLESLCPRGAVHTVQVGNLTENDISLLLQSLLSLPADKVQPLVECLLKKTAGNMFYLKQFLLSLVQRKLLYFQLETMQWTFDIAQIHSNSMATENVVGLLTAKILELPALIQQILPRIACLGSKFKTSTVNVVLDHSMSSLEDVKSAVDEYNSKNSAVAQEDNNRNGVATPEDEADVSTAILAICESEGLIVRDATSCRWEHDRIREAAIGLLSQAEMRSVQHQVGELLFNELPPDELTNDLFVVTDLLNSTSINDGVVAIQDSQERIKLAGINLRAGKMALSLTAFAAAVDFLTNSLVYLEFDKQKWENHYDLSLDLFSFAARAFYCVGDYEKAMNCCNAVLSNENVPFMDKRPSYNIKIRAIQAEGKSAKQLILDVLAKLGCTFPRFGKTTIGMCGVAHFLATYDKSAKKIMEAKPMEDEEKQWVVYLLDRLIEQLFTWADKELVLLVFVRANEWTCKYGIAEYTPVLLVQIAILFVNFGYIDAAKTYGELSRRFISYNTAPRVLFVGAGFIRGNSEPLENCKDPFLKAYKHAMRIGDLETGFWSIYAFLEFQIITGANLPSVLDDCAIYVREMEQYNHVKPAWMTKLVWQIADCLANPHAGGSLLEGTVIENIDTFAKTTGTEIEHVGRNMKRYQIVIAFWFNDHERVVNIMFENDYQNFSMDKEVPGHPGNKILYIQCALSCIALARTSSNPQGKKKLLKIARRIFQKVKSWGKSGDPNHQYHESLIEAEFCSLANPSLAPLHYDQAIVLGGRWGLANYRALAHERYGDFADQKGDANEARYQYSKALEWYGEWGATAKANHLRQELATKFDPMGEQSLRYEDVKRNTKGPRKWPSLRSSANSWKSGSSRDLTHTPIQ